MNLRTLVTIISITFALPVAAQQTKRDTVKIPLGKSSQIILTIGDRSDIETLQHYDFQKLFSDVLTKLENPEGVKKDSMIVAKADSTLTDSTGMYVREQSSETYRRDNDDDDDDEDWEFRSSRRRWGRTWQSFNFDLGTNNYLDGGGFPDRDNAPYAVRPWGSWYIAINSTQRSRLGRNFFVEWAAGVSWYTFKFQNSNTVIIRDDSRVTFIEDNNQDPNRPDRSYSKSKLGITFINASIIPVLDFGDHSRKPRMWNGTHSALRIGLGPYVGYRISSLSKVVYKEGGDREKDKDRGNFYLNNLRYGARLQLGFRSTDFFFNYDLNELFASGRGPKLNAFSFGVIF